MSYYSIGEIAISGIENDQYRPNMTKEELLQLRERLLEKKAKIEKAQTEEEKFIKQVKRGVELCDEEMKKQKMKEEKEMLACENQILCEVIKEDSAAVEAAMEYIDKCSQI